MNDNTKKSRIRRLVKKSAFIELFGGECEKCGEKDHFLLSFHHMDPSKKLFNSSQLWDCLPSFSDFINKFFMTKSLE